MNEYGLSLLHVVYIFSIIFLLFSIIKNQSPAAFNIYAYVSIPVYLFLLYASFVYPFQSIRIENVSFLQAGFLFFLMRAYDGFQNYKKLKNNYRNEIKDKVPGFLIQIFSPTFVFCGPAVMQKDFGIVSETFLKFSEHYRKSSIFVMLGFSKILFILPFIERNFETSLLLPFTFQVQAFKNLFFSGLFHYIEFYLSFSALCDLSYGFSGLMGIKTRHNFFRPYLAVSLLEFWKRWNRTAVEFMDEHIFKNKFYSLKGKSPVLFFLPVAAGVWYGLSSEFFLWGLLHGCALWLEKSFFPLDEADQKKISFKNILRYLFTQIFIIFSWSVFFWRF